MIARRLFAILIMALPIVAFAWIVGTTGFADATVGVETPRYPDIKASEFVKLDREQLAKALADATEKTNRMSNLWKDAKASYDRLLYVLLGIVTVVCIALSFFLWRAPPNNTVERDARNNSVRPSL